MSPGSGAAERSPAMRRGRRGGKGGEAKAEAAMVRFGFGFGFGFEIAESSSMAAVRSFPAAPRLLTCHRPHDRQSRRSSAPRFREYKSSTVQQNNMSLLSPAFYMDGRWATTATTSIFLAAAITDWLDGYIARKMRLGTAFGAFLDPVADKYHLFHQQITMSAVREWAASQNSRVLEAVAVNKLGKWKTATQMTALTILLVARDPSLQDKVVLVGSGVLLLYISAGLAVWSLVVYMKKIWKILLK
ncbi:Cardiolipin synthase (CMP-forming), mitochondrial [Ananas comosus]|uniref:Cardiolipin synthase (CMP-forming), mitochondrial n=1 Tax=Ananas comosus TaxID=4615 RepID=A0A199UZY3_ANACO|nr:Cardiolipin synthase (CMP-forming), mitochondrial [Ananas comosus]